MTTLRKSRSLPWKYTTNNESIANLSRLSLPPTVPMVERNSTEQESYDEILSGVQSYGVKAEPLAVSQTKLGTILEISLSEHSKDATALDQVQSETIPPSRKIQTKSERFHRY
jgi:hypothetical protein